VAHAYDVTLVTYEKYPGLPPDDVLLREAFERGGATVRSAVWSDPEVDWAASASTLVRATWDYPQRFDEFWRWLAHVETRTRLINDVRILRWNAHKRYLADLERAGVRIAPTLFVESGLEFDLAAACAPREWDDVVIKPCVGGGSYGARRFRGAEIASGGARHLRHLLQTGDAMLQPYLREIEQVGELACIFIDGSFTHAVKKPPFNSSPETTSEHLCELDDEDLALVTGIVEGIEPVPAYARVDVVPASDGTLLMELELIEPSLYFAFEPEAARRLVDCVLRPPKSM
jgi:glutathione synthase/RimK-type ligase-like ATP-grasp enzyme